MINHSKFCVVYYDENHLPPRRKNSRRDLFDYQPKSGTAVAYSYAITKKKTIINTFENKKAPKTSAEIFAEYLTKRNTLFLVLVSIVVK